jgi:cellobiose phosphorylase
MLGVDADYEGLRIKPCIPSSWKECSLVRRWRGADYHVVIRNPSGLQGGGIDLVIDGRKMKGNLVPAFADGNLHEVCVTLVEVEAKDPAEAGQASPICD